MASGPSLASMPVEVIETLVILLDLSDLRSFRLTSPEVAARSSHGVFRSYFCNKTVKLTSDEQQLGEFVHMTQPAQIGCLVQHLTLTAPILRDPEVGKRNTPRLLGKAMRNIHLNSPRGCLLSVSLANEPDKDKYGRNWPSVWESAGELFPVTALALEASKLPIYAFDVFGSIDRCSLACDNLATVLEKVDFSTSLASMKQLSLSLSQHVVHEPENERLRSLATGQRHTKAICQLLRLCPALEDLQLHWYSLVYRSDLTDALEEEQYFFDRIAASSCRFPALKRLTLRGISTSETALLPFPSHLQQLHSLDMEEIHLGGRGKFGPVFDYLFKHREQLRLEHVHLNDLWELKLMCFEAPGQPRFPSSGNGNGPNELTRIEANARRLIKYREMRGVARGSAASANWTRRVRTVYGHR